MADLLVLGNGLAGLIVALEAGRLGRRVTLLPDGRAPGGHFTGMSVDELDFDVGMVMFERSLPNQPCDDWADFNPSQRQDWTRFGHLVWAWLDQQMPLRQVPTPQCRVNGAVWPDYLIANRLEAFAHSGLPAPDPRQLDAVAHPRHKLKPGIYDVMSYADAASANHGEALHRRFIEPFVRKLTGINSQAFLARWHRAAWAPLFYPETVAAAVAGADHGLPEYPFWVPANGCVAQWTRQLQDALRDCPSVTRCDVALAQVQANPRGWLATTADGKTWQADRAVWATPAPRGCELLGLAPPPADAAVSVSVMLCSVSAEALAIPPSCLMVVDDDFASYRLTCPDAQAGLNSSRWRFALEANPERLARQYPGQEPSQSLCLELARLLNLSSAQPVQVHRLLTAKNALALPTAAVVQHAEATHARFKSAAPRSWLTGNLLGHGLAAINDQIAQALHIRAEIAA